MTVTQNYDNIIPNTPILSADPNVKEDVMTDQQKITILYCRLSNEDSQDGESNSIQNQRELLTRYAREHSYTNLKVLYASRKGKPLPKNPYGWKDQSIVGILERQEYTGCTCNFKTYSKSYKLKKRIPNNPEDMFIVPDTQEAIVSQAQWDRVQELRKNKRRPAKAERQGLFSGLLYCADCGGKLHFATCKSFEGKQDHYVCSKYKSGRGDCSAHYIREDVLRELVLERIQAVNEYIRSDVEGFQEEWVEQRQAMGDDLDAFIALTKKYVDVTELTQTIVNEYIKKIIIHAPDKSGGKRRQKVEIIFNFVDEVEIPVLAEPMIAESTLGRRKTA